MIKHAAHEVSFISSKSYFFAISVYQYDRLLNMQAPLTELRPGIGPAAPFPFQETLLPACGGQLDLRVGYTWTRSQVIEMHSMIPMDPRDSVEQSY